ncbi:MAG: hypothetical protein GXO07_02475 [Crenarchaeota archaeon]|nr:hypothetical protein [Thermoproteota archaeon]
MAVLVVPDWLLVFLAYASAQAFWYRALASLIINLVYGMNQKSGCWFLALALGLAVALFNTALLLSMVTLTSPLAEPLLLFPLLGALVLELPLLYLFVDCLI